MDQGTEAANGGSAMTVKIRNSTMTRIFDAREHRPQSHGAVQTCDDGGTTRPGAAGPGLLRVLILDDCRDAADSMAMLVKLWGYMVRVAYDGAAALDMIAAYPPDVLLLDIAMPGMDGFHLARQLRRETRFQDTLLIAMTGYADREHRLLWAGAFDHYLVKPVEPSIVKNFLMLKQDRHGKLSENPHTIMND
jgi:CheY-like chemotaxis protein